MALSDIDLAIVMEVEENGLSEKIDEIKLAFHNTDKTLQEIMDQYKNPPQNIPLPTINFQLHNRHIISQHRINNMIARMENINALLHAINTDNSEEFTDDEDESEDSDEFSDDVHLVLKQSELDKLETLTFDKLKEKKGYISDDEYCSICLMGFSNDEELNEFTILKCNHAFHTPCIKEQLSKYDYHCPVCRMDVGQYMPKIE